MKYHDFIETVIERGITAAKQSYVRVDSTQVVVDKCKLVGSIAGFEACKNKLPQELLVLWVRATDKMNEVAAQKVARDVYLYWRCYQAEIEYVCDVVSAMLVNSGKRALLKGFPTIQGVNMARKILLVERN